MLSLHRLVLLSAFALAACGANPPDAEAGQDTTGAEPAAVAAQNETAAVTQDPAIAEDDAPLRATPPPPGPNLPDPDENGVITINWDDLLPEGEMERIEELYAASSVMMEMNHFGGQMPQIGTFNVEPALIGQTVRMPGYILPLDYQPGGDITEFLLVPYFGACVHTPPPPPNQIVYVTSEEPVRVERLWAAVWVTGVMTADRHMNDLGDAAYTMQLTGHEPYRR
jgi:hypothetical protein